MQIFFGMKATLRACITENLTTNFETLFRKSYPKIAETDTRSLEPEPEALSTGWETVEKNDLFLSAIKLKSLALTPEEPISRGWEKIGKDDAFLSATMRDKKAYEAKDRKMPLLRQQAQANQSALRIQSVLRGPHCTYRVSSTASCCIEDSKRIARSCCAYRDSSTASCSALRLQSEQRGRVARTKFVRLRSELLSFQAVVRGQLARGEARHRRGQLKAQGARIQSTKRGRLAWIVGISLFSDAVFRFTAAIFA